MTHPNVELLSRYFDAWDKGDIEAAEEFYADDVVAHLPGCNPRAVSAGADVLLAGAYHGKEAVKGYINKLVEVTEGKIELLEQYDILASDKYGVTILKARFHRPGKEPLVIHRAVVFHLDQGKILEFWVHDENPFAVDEFFS